MATTTQQQKKAGEAKARRPSAQPPGQKSPVGAYAPSLEDIQPRVVRVKAKHVLLACGALLVVVCASGWFILNVKNKLQQRRFIEAFKAAPDTIYALGYVMNSMAQNGLIGHQVPPQIHPPSHMLEDN